MTQEKMPILKAKIERIVKANDAPRVELLIVLASHKGLIMPDSIHTSFMNFKQKYGEGKFAEVLGDFKDDGIVTENYGIRFAVNDERGQFDYKSGEQLSEFVGRLVYEASPQMKQVVEDLLKEPEGRELLAYVAKENGLHILDGIEPKVKDVIGKRSYHQIMDNLVTHNILTEYAWSSRKHGYTGYKLLPWVGVYLRKELGIYELMDVEKSVLSYLACINNIFDYPADRWFTWINDPNEFDRRKVQLSRLHGKMIASLTYSTESEVLKAIEELKRKGLTEEQDLGYTKGGFHRGKVLELTEAGAKVASQVKDDMLNKVEQKTKEIFSDKINGAVYYLFREEKMPVKILSSVLTSSVDTLQRCGLIGERTDIYLEFKAGTFYSDYANSGIDPEDMKTEFREKCAAILSPEEKLLLGFLSEGKHIILYKQLDTKSWGAVTSRTQRKYDEAYRSLILNFKPLMKLFSYVTGLPLERSEEIATILEEKSFLVREDASNYGFPGYATIYRVAIKFGFDIDAAPLKTKASEYIGFLTKDLERNYRQLMFLDYLTQLYDKHDCHLVVDRHYVEPILEFLRYSPPAKYSPIYAFEDETVLLYPPVKEQLEEEISELKSKLAEPVRAEIARLTRSYEINVSFNYWAADRNGYFVVEIESPDPAIGTVSFVVTAWVYVYDIEKIKALCSKSNTINLFVSYPDYPQVKNIISDEARYNLFIIRHDTAHVWLNRLDPLTQDIVTTLGEQFRVIKEEAEVELPEGEEVPVEQGPWFGRNRKFEHPRLGEVELKYLSLDDFYKTGKFISEGDARDFTSLVIHNQLLTPEMSLSEIKSWRDQLLEEVASELLENESFISRNFQRDASHTFFEDFREAFQRAYEEHWKAARKLVDSLTRQWEPVFKRVADFAGSTRSMAALSLFKSPEFLRLSESLRTIYAAIQSAQRPYILSDASLWLTTPFAIPVRPKVSIQEQTEETIASLLGAIDPQLERRRQGAWQTFYGKSADRISQAIHSMREVLRQLLDKLAPGESIVKAPWYSRPAKGAPVTRTMKVRYAIGGRNCEVSESTLDFIDSLASVVEEAYSKLSAEAHQYKEGIDAKAEAYLKSCEAVILLVLVHRKV